MKYETKSQILLKMLLEDTEYELALCGQRMNLLLNEGDDFNADAEMLEHNKLSRKREKLLDLFHKEAGYTNRKVRVKISFETEKGNEVTQEIRESEVIC